MTFHNITKLLEKNKKNWQKLRYFFYNKKHNTWELQLNPTVNGTFTYADLANSSVQYAQGVVANTIATDGLVLSRGGASTETRVTQSDLKTALRIGSDIDGTKDTLVLVFRPFSANASVWGTVNFRELL